MCCAAGMRIFSCLLLCACGGPCPDAVPTDGTACGLPGLSCEYGGDAHLLCSQIADCLDGTWSVPANQCVPASNCPAAFGANRDCLSRGPCDYPEGRCECTACSGGVHWQCRAWTDVGPGCDPTRPRAGSACSSEGAQCNYADCCGVSLGPDLVCTDGRWDTDMQVDTACVCALFQC
jgi:hypothetical protein